ncbi:hypothetical protein LWP59_27605 [Amycolatopsis acidiphila]|uniref:Uncharacterized protein n=1 Tax=Amycolatopsis acidiphila TaxID=715473 RepID=A0A558A130_9PSEU|nr:hypothetical protein [Amycolatopsis acidiphila]TVT17960.1 hypothetical protein FNH06_29500 [Amycolatopsis acidiphila]UIJ57860.1 hypothetical protein LWP59_27485 [Amycolatopsis acidiphila]UIJ57883.1 hypothetical protein LWP59_27605 [Amycolatopsis acidiphila]GHG71359.1 hypothetical protein GCM10017788_33220 [Amycolatopsis acidiphila]
MSPQARLIPDWLREGREVITETLQYVKERPPNSPIHDERVYAVVNLCKQLVELKEDEVWLHGRPSA